MSDDKTPTGVWVVETGCKYDNCGDVDRYATYDNEAAARQHGAVVEKAIGDTNLEVRVYEVRVPAVQYSTVPPLDGDGWPA